MAGKVFLRECGNSSLTVSEPRCVKNLICGLSISFAYGT